jgi:hypothetical protein
MKDEMNKIVSELKQLNHNMERLIAFVKQTNKEAKQINKEAPADQIGSNGEFGERIKSEK